MALSRFVLPFADVGKGISPSSGAKLFFYATGTSTPASTFSDLAGSIPNANPVIADANGLFSDIFLSGTYKVILKDKNDVQIWETDSVNTDTDTDQNLQIPYIFNTIAELKASLIEFPNGKYIEWMGYYTKLDGGQNWGIVKSGAHTDDGGSIFTLADGKYVEANLEGGSINTLKFGSYLDGQDSTAKIQACIDYVVSLGGGNPKLPIGLTTIFDTIFLKASAVRLTGFGRAASRLTYLNAAGGTAISGDSDKELSMNTYTYCELSGFSILSSNYLTDPDVTIDYTSFSYSDFDLAVTNRRPGGALYQGQGNNGSSPYYNWFRGYLFGGDGAGGTAYSQTGIKSIQGLLGDAYQGSNGANANKFGPFPRCAALGYIVDMQAGNGNMFTDIFGESIITAYYKFNQSTAVESGTSTGSNTQNSFKDAGATWTSSLINAAVKITSGKGIGQIRAISSNTSTSVALTDVWAIIPDATSVYEIYASKAADNIITLNRTEGLATSGPEFIIALPGTRGTKETLNVVGSLGAGLHIQDESGFTNNKWFSETQVVFTENIQNPGPSANIDVYAKNSVFGGVSLYSSYVVNWLTVASTTGSLNDDLTVTLDVGGTGTGNGDFTFQTVMETGTQLAMDMAGPTDRQPRAPSSRRLFLNVQTGASFSASADIQITWCATIV